MLAVGDKLYMFGGCGSSGRLADLWEYDVEEHRWEELPGCDEISGRGGPGFVQSSDGKSLFVVGGFSGREMNDVFQYSISSRSWTRVLEDGNPHVQPFSVSSGYYRRLSCVFRGRDF